MPTDEEANIEGQIHKLIKRGYIPPLSSADNIDKVVDHVIKKRKDSKRIPANNRLGYE